MRKAIAGMTLAFTLSACTSNLANFHPTMEADPAETGAEGFIYMDELSKAYTVIPYETNAGDYFSPRPTCSFFRESYQEHEKYTLRRYKRHNKYKDHPNISDDEYDDDHGKKKESARKDFRCLVFKDDATEKSVRNFSLAGFALSDLYCRNFFRRVGLHSSTRGYIRDSINDVGTAMSAILGLASAGSAVTGGIGAGFGIAESAYANYDKEFMVSADLPSVEKQVIATQQDYAKTYLAGKMPTSYLEAAMAIQQHANFCSFLGMRSLVTTAVESDAAKKSGTTPPAASPTANKPTAADLKTAYATLIKAKAAYKKSRDATHAAAVTAARSKYNSVVEAMYPLGTPAPTK